MRLCLCEYHGKSVYFGVAGIVTHGSYVALVRESSGIRYRRKPCSTRVSDEGNRPSEISDKENIELPGVEIISATLRHSVMVFLRKCIVFVNERKGERESLSLLIPLLTTGHWRDKRTLCSHLDIYSYAPLALITELICFVLCLQSFLYL